ncbi:hybrid sensor histidine kinase/response regulator [Vibrio mediterranei]
MERIKRTYEYAAPNITLVAWMGILGFPLYYVIWKYVFPQPYESELLRTIGAIMLIGFILLRAFSEKTKRILPYYYLVVIGFTLPFFFCYMMLMNNWTTVWVMSFMSSIFLHILLIYDTRIMVAQAVISVVSAVILAYIMGGQGIYMEQSLTYLPIFAFTYIFGSLFFFRNQNEHESKFAIAKSFGAGIAHEMRNPLSAMYSSLEVMRAIIPNKSAIFRNSHQLNTEELQRLNEIIDDSMKTIMNGNETIDLLLTSIDQSRVSTSTFCRNNGKEVIENAIRTFAYKTALDNKAVSVNIPNSFDYFGSDTLLKYVLFNLLKNSFRHRGAGKFTITIDSQTQDDCNIIIFRDTGKGIEEQLLPYIFEDFYTTGKSGSYGLGLAFCKKVMRSFGGKIVCQSEFGAWTEFKLIFPKYESAEVAQIKSELIKDKSVLFIGESSSMLDLVKSAQYHREFKLTVEDIKAASYREEYSFEYSLIIIDGNLSREGWIYLSSLEAKLEFTEARIVLVHSANDQRNLYFKRYLNVELMDYDEFTSDIRDTLDKLFFREVEELATVRPYNTISSTKTVLLVDDNHSLRTITSIMLEKEGLVVLQASNGADALVMLDEENVDLVIMDIEMPILDGISTADKIRKSTAKYSTVPIIAFTGDANPTTREKIKQSGMDDLLIKPTPKDELVDKVASWI